MNTEPRIKKMVIIVALLVLAIMLYGIILQVSRIGKTKITISVLPSEATVLVNDKKVSKSSVYLKPGQYKITARADGYVEDTVDLNVDNKEPDPVILLPKPDSDEAIAFFENNPSLQAQKEGLGGQKASEAGQKIREKYPIISQLPYIDILGPFSVDYGASKNQPESVVLYVSDSSPGGRQKALKWIRENNQEPTDLEIVFSDYLSPLTGNKQPEGQVTQ